jgi:hypothetical protein
MAESLTDMAEALRWKSLPGNSQDKYKGYWTQWQQWGQMMEMPEVSIWLEYSGTWQPTRNDREQDLGHPFAFSGAGWIRTGDRCGTCPVDASTQTLV